MNDNLPEEIQNIVCEEILRDGLLKYFPDTTIEQKQLIFAAMKRYAEREVEAAKQPDRRPGKMCNCIKDIEQRMQADMADYISKGGNNIVVKEKAEFVNKAISFGSNSKINPVFLYLPVEGKYMRGKQNNKWTANITFSYCPFCGEKKPGKEAGNDE